MNTKELRKIMKPTTKKAKTIYLKEYLENADSVTIKYCFKGQKESNLKIPYDTWRKMRFEVTESNDIEITNIGDLEINTNENNWSRLVLKEEEVDD